MPVPEGVRPTADRVREALFSMIGQQLEGTSFLDAFGGTGMVGLDAWSRGARVVVAERSRRIARLIEERGEVFGADWRVVPGDARIVAEAHGPFDGIFADPPYAEDPAAILGWLAPHATGWLVFETERKATLPEQAGDLVLDRSRDYTRTRLWVYRGVP